MTRRYRQFTLEFKLEAIRLLESREKPAAQLARELDIRVNQIYKWKKQLDTKPDSAFKRTKKSQEAKPSPTGISNTDADEIKRLRKQVERLEAEKDILKKQPLTSPKTLCKVSVYSGSPESLSTVMVVQLLGGIKQWLLRMAQWSGKCAE